MRLFKVDSGTKLVVSIIAITLLVMSLFPVIYITGFATLPTVGGNSGTWGTVLNDFLQVEHNSDGTHGNVTIQGDLNLNRTYTKFNFWNLSAARYNGSSKDTLSGTGETIPYDLAFKPDGTVMFFIGSTNNRVYQYSLSAAWDVSTASYTGLTFTFNEENIPYGLAFNGSGDKMYITGTNDSVYQYTLATPWDVSTASYDNVSLNVSANVTNPIDITFKNDGSKFYLATGVTIFEYNLSDPWNVSSALYSNKNFSVSSQDTNPEGMEFNGTGNKMYIIGNSNNFIYQYTLATPWDVSTASYDGESLNVSSEETTPEGIALKVDDGSKIYIIGQTTDEVYEYNVFEFQGSNGELSIGSINPNTWPSFHANLGGGTAQTITRGSSYATLELDTELFDTNNNFDTSTYRFKPTVPGKYLLSATISPEIAHVDGTNFYVAILKNGVDYYETVYYSSGFGGSTNVILDADGVYDYFEAQVRHSGAGTTDIDATPRWTYFSGSRIA